MARIKTQKSDYQVIRDCVTGLFYIGKIEIDPDGMIYPCPSSKVSDFFDTFEQANQWLGTMRGANNVGRQ